MFRIFLTAQTAKNLNPLARERETPFMPILDKLTAKSWFFTNFEWKRDNGIEENLLFQPMVAFN